MDFSKYTSLLFILGLSFLVTSSQADDTNQTTTVTTTNTNTTANDESGLTDPPDEVDNSIVELKSKQCMIILGDCWLYLKDKKPRYNDEKRLALCKIRTLGFLICEGMTDAQITKAKEEAEERVSKAKDEAEALAKQKAEKAEDRAKRRAEELEKRAQEAEERAQRKEQRAKERAAAAAEAAAAAAANETMTTTTIDPTLM